MKRMGELIFSAVLAVGVILSGQVQADSLSGLSLKDPYLRLSVGGGKSSYSKGMWHSPGPGDPDVYFNLNGKKPFVGTVAIGATMAPGLRGELALTGTGRQSVTGTWSYTVPTVPGPHADITSASVRSTALMANAIYAPMEATQPEARIQPFLLGGIGIAANSVGDWTRTNAAAVRPVRTFEGRTSYSFAWTAGVGVSVNVSKTAAKPIYLESMLQYIDFGTARGGSTPLPGMGTSTPITPFQFKHSAAVLSVGLRIPF
ncbi:outer membrane protein [Pseudooceanicola sp. MF1-13]|uniref:outer membrane protein n=1 Tax=Pseudooceanicola sp. MF1-13 TaxID=3379095 RepID=UPI00389171DA